MYTWLVLVMGVFYTIPAIQVMAGVLVLKQLPAPSCFSSF